MTNFPTTLDTFQDPSPTTLMNAPGLQHDVQHTNLNDAVEALQTKVGINGSADTTSMDYKIAQFVAMLLTPANAQVRIQVIAGAAQLQIFDAGYNKFVPIVSNNGVLGTGAPLAN